MSRLCLLSLTVAVSSFIDVFVLDHVYVCDSSRFVLCFPSPSSAGFSFLRNPRAPVSRHLLPRVRIPSILQDTASQIHLQKVQLQKIQLLLLRR